MPAKKVQRKVAGDESPDAGSPQDDNMEVDSQSGQESADEKPASEGANESADEGENEGENEVENEDENENEVEDEKEEASDADKDSGDEERPEEAEEGAANVAAPEVDPIFDQTLMKPVFERREKSLKELLGAMDEFSPIIPDAVTDYYLTRSGFKSSDVRIKRLLALATQKFVADIANDAYQFSRIRAQSGNAPGGPGKRGTGPSSGRTVLTMESLSGVLEDYGIDARRPDFFR